jgi:hypothetical protein
MGIDIKFKPEAMLEVLKEFGVDIRHVIAAVEVFQQSDGFLKKAENLFRIAQAVAEAVEWERINGLSAEDAIRIGSQALDALFEFSGTVWGVVPAGALLEAYDGTIIDLLLKWAYEAIRDRDNLDDDDFADKVKAAFV